MYIDPFYEVFLDTATLQYHNNDNLVIEYSRKETDNTILELHPSKPSELNGFTKALTLFKMAL